jgi:hypothetical protein
VLGQGALAQARRTLRRVLARRGLPLSKELEARIDACVEVERLDGWLDRALGAGSAAEVFDEG